MSSPLDIRVNGRTGENRSVPTVTRIERRKSGTFFLRVDDANNPEFWLEIAISNDKMKEISKK